MAHIWPECRGQFNLVTFIAQALFSKPDCNEMNRTHEKIFPPFEMEIEKKAQQSLIMEQVVMTMFKMTL